MNKLAPFTEKQHKYLLRCLSSWFNVAEGGKRGGKNVLQTMAFCIGLDSHPNRLHLVAGVSTATARLNILDCDGYGLLNYFEGRCRSGEYQNRSCLYIDALRGGQKVVLISGGGKNGDEKLIKGNSYGTAYITEANECAYVFIKEVFDRTLSSRDRKIYHDLNPKSEGHWYYEDILNLHENKQAENPDYGYNYGHFTIADNMSISDEQLKRELNTYDKSSIWYKRDIRGERKQAEGLVYPNFINDIKSPQSNVVPTVNRAYTKYYISNDYGTQHPCVFLLWGLYGGVWYCIKEYYHNGSKERQKTVDDYYADLLNFAKGYRIARFIRDKAPIAASFNIHLIRKADFASCDCDNEVLAGIQDVASALNNGLIKINDCCVNTIREFGLFSWDKNSANDKVIEKDDDTMDCMRYFVRTMKIAESKSGSMLYKL